MTKKVKRFHRGVYFPEWTEESLDSFLQEVLQTGYITFSAHALKRTVEYTDEHGKSFLRFLLKCVKRNALSIQNVFEFYSVEEYIKKVCFRCSTEELPVDLVLVISRDATVITVFVVNRGDNHETMDKTLYEKE